MRPWHYAALIVFLFLWLITNTICDSYWRSQQRQDLIEQRAKGIAQQEEAKKQAEVAKRQFEERINRVLYPE